MHVADSLVTVVIHCHLVNGGRSHHQVVFDLLAAVCAGAVKVEMFLQLLLPVGGHIQEVHVADSQLLALGNLLQGSELNPGTQWQGWMDGWMDGKQRDG